MFCVFTHGGFKMLWSCHVGVSTIWYTAHFGTPPPGGTPRMVGGVEITCGPLDVGRWAAMNRDMAGN